MRTARDRLLRPDGGREAHAGPERAWPRTPEANQTREGRWTPREEVGTCSEHSCGARGEEGGKS